MISFLTGWQGMLGACALAAIISGSGVGYVIHRMDQSTIQAMKTADLQEAVTAEKQAASAQKSEDDVNLAAAVAEAQAQQKIVTQTVTITKEIPVHVPDTSHCDNGPTVGLVRMLDTASGRDPASLGIATSEPDADCAPISWSAFASEIADDYGIGNQNAEQLNALETDVRELVKAANQ